VSRRGLRTLSLVVGVTVLPLSWAAFTPGSVAVAQSAQSPNVVLIVTDDQRADSLWVMPNVQRLLVRRGISLRGAVVSNPLCCPARASILTGRYSHTTGVYANRGDAGGWSAFAPSEGDTIATALDAAGYRTALIGKYLNGYGQISADVPPGWDRWFAITDPEGAYYNYTVRDDEAGLVSFASQASDYSTDVFAAEAVRFVHETAADTPFFLMVTPYAPHAPATPAPRHAGDFASARVTFGPAVNEADVSDKPSYVRVRDPLPLSRMRNRQRARWESLQAVDELVAAVVAAVRDTGRANTTLVLFTSDNGPHREGGHDPDFFDGNGPLRGIKRDLYEGGVRVPFIVRAPGRVPAGRTSDHVWGMWDLLPTLAALAGAAAPRDVDGLSMVRALDGRAAPPRHEWIYWEFYEQGSAQAVRMGRWKAVRRPMLTGPIELYDLDADLGERRDVAAAHPDVVARAAGVMREAHHPSDLWTPVGSPPPVRGPAGSPAASAGR